MKVWFHILKYAQIQQPKKDDETELRQLLEKCAATAMSSKLINQQKDFFSKMVVDAVMLLDDLLPLNMIGMKKVPGGALEVETDKFFQTGQQFKLALIYKF